MVHTDESIFELSLHIVPERQEAARAKKKAQVATIN
jgi:hypothetical protein